MKLTLRWSNLNVLPTTTDIFRSASPIDPQALPAVHASVNASLEQFEDDVVYGQRYYYMFRNRNSKGSVLSNNIEAWGLPYTGPGPQNLLRGDYSRGYFGQVGKKDFISSYDLCNAIDPAVFSLVYAVQEITWHKFAYKGKILFIPNGAINQIQPTFAQLYALGIVYGSNDNGRAIPAGSAPRNQYRTVDIGNDSFVIRLPRLKDEEDPFLAPGVLTADGEWMNTVVALLDYVPNVMAGEALANYVTQSKGHSTSEEFIANQYVRFQEMVNTSNNLIIATGNDEMTLIVSQSVTQGSGYVRTVLELVTPTPLA